MNSSGKIISYTTPMSTPSMQQINHTSLAKTTSSRRRDKPQLSCHQCRRRKSRCDRQRPCSCCSTRSQLCTYPENQTTAGPSEVSSPAGLSAHDRIVQLECLVMSLMPDPAGKLNRDSLPDVGASSIQGVVTPASSMQIESPIDARSECGSMKISDSELHYVGGDHWVAILDGIADLKDQLDREEQLRLAGSPEIFEDEPRNYDSSSAEGSQSGGAFLLYGCRRATSRDEILSALPPKYAVDRYVSRYFNYLDLVSSSAVHGPSFLREYNLFWADPSSASVIWVGLLFSMICLACLASDPLEGPEAELQSLQVDLYREKIVQCLFMGKYTKTGPYVLETVINYIYVEFCIHPDADKDMWLLLALEVNLARRMGYHRDPSHFSGLSPFQGEMRRRLWATVLMGDILVSNQMGMPRMISDSQYDTAEPRNLNDHDFDHDSTELPPSRPESELTTALGIIARTRMLKALGIVADLTSAIKPCQYTEVMRVDNILHEAVKSIPSPLKMKPMEASLTDSPQVIVSRLFIQHMFYKGKVMLHRRFVYMHTSEKEEAYRYSRKACLDASLGTLEIQHVLDEETSPGGQLHTMRWRVTSIMNHQFLIATMLLCSLLYHGQTMERESEIRGALQRSRTIWMRRSSTSKEAKRAAETVSIILTRSSEGHQGSGQSCWNVNGENGDHGFHGNIRTTQNADVSFEADGAKTSPYDADQSVIADLLGTLMPHDQDLGFNIGNSGAPSDGWMTFVNWPGPT